MPHDFRHDLATAACRHRLLYEVAESVHKKTIAPEDANICRLSDEVRLVRQHDRRQPTRLRKGDEAALARNVARDVSDETKECRIVQSRGKRHPLRLTDMAGEVLGVTEQWLASGNLLPQRPCSADGLAIQDRYRIHGS